MNLKPNLCVDFVVGWILKVFMMRGHEFNEVVKSFFVFFSPQYCIILHQEKYQALPEVSVEYIDVLFM